jgi:hypothetical protein
LSIGIPMWKKGHKGSRSTKSKVWGLFAWRIAILCNFYRRQYPKVQKTENRCNISFKMRYSIKNQNEKILNIDWVKNYQSSTHGHKAVIMFAEYRSSKFFWIPWTTSGPNPVRGESQMSDPCLTAGDGLRTKNNVQEFRHFFTRQS